MDDLISVVVPCFNAEKTIADTIVSVLSQTHKNLECVVIDDCSTDNSLAIIEHVKSTDSRVEVIALSKNVGVAAARNIGLANSKGFFFHSG